MPGELAIEDRIRIQDLLMRYVWANDSANLEGVVGVFTPDGIVQPSTGERIPARRWATETFAHPGRRGRQHWAQLISIDAIAEGATARSYWKVLQWRAAADTKAIHAMGYYEDVCVKLDGQWRIKEKRIYRCNDETPLPW
jgi:hypothetical protein